MKVVILCGGLGTRLREETEYRPKPMVPIGDRPMLWHIMKRYAMFGFKEFVLCLGYKADMIQDYFLNYRVATGDFTLKLDGRSPVQFHSQNREEDWSITFASTGQNAMTGARIKRIEPYIDSDSFMLTYGDGLSDIDLHALQRFHDGHDRIGTVTGVRPGAGRFGELALDGTQVTQFTEKPESQNEGYINSGFFILRRDIFRYVRDDDQCVFEHEPLQRLAQEGQLMSFRHEGAWHCMDTYRDYRQLNELWNRGDAPWAVPPATQRPRARGGDRGGSPTEMPRAAKRAAAARVAPAR